MGNAIELVIEVDAKTGKAVIKDFTGTVEQKTKKMSERVIRQVKKMETRFRKGLTGAIGRTGRALTSLKTLAMGALAGWGLKLLAEGFILVGDSMDKMRISLDTITHGAGDIWFERLNNWALKMPVNTEKAIQSFTMMRAMGLQPTIADMTTLVDTTSALGGQSDTMEGIARALGQIKTKGKVSAEELMQLAERGVPAYEILRQKLGLTAQEVANIGNSGVDANEAVEALLAGMDERFGGQSGKIQQKWGGLMESLRSYWTEFRRQVMSDGVMDWMEERLGGVISRIDQMLESGSFAIYAQKMAAKVTKSLDWIWKKGEEVYTWWLENNDEVKQSIRGLIDQVRDAKNYINDHAGYIKALAGALLVLYGAVKLYQGGNALVDFYKTATVFAKAHQLSVVGVIKTLGKLGLAAGAAWGAYQTYKVGKAAWELSQQSGLQADAAAQTAAMRARIEQKTGQPYEPGAFRDGYAEQQRQRQQQQELLALEQAVAKSAIDSAMEVAREDKSILAGRLDEYRKFYNDLETQIDKAAEQEKKHLKELNVLYKQKADLQRSTAEMVRSLQETQMTEAERYSSQQAALEEDFTRAMELQGQERVKALEAYKQAAASFGRRYVEGISDQGELVIDGSQVVSQAIADIERASGVQQEALTELAAKKESLVEADRIWLASLQESAAEAVTEIDILQGVIGELSSQINSMQKNIDIEAQDYASPIVDSIQLKLSQLHDKTVTITTVNNVVSSGAVPSYAEPTLDSYAAGTRYVPKTGKYNLHEGEIVNDRRTSDAIRRKGSETPSGPAKKISVDTVNIIVPETAAPQTPEDWRTIVRDHVIPELEAAGA